MEIPNLIAAARKAAQRSESCIPPMASPKVTSATIAGWTLCLDMYRHGQTEHWRFSAKLFPPGRGSVEEDWGNLGKIVAAIYEGTGYPGTGHVPDALVPIETAHPNATHHWMWHSDGSEVDPAVLGATKAILEQMALGAPVASPTTSKEPSRNEACPCGSGRKYKKCHGGN